MSIDPLAELGGFLTATEAARLAAQIHAGLYTAAALDEIGAARRESARQLLEAAQLGSDDRERTVSVLRAISGAKREMRQLTPVWTMPGNEAKVGHLTGEFHRIARGARQSVTAATYNFEGSSQMWTVLEEASEQVGVVVTVYVDGTVADATAVKKQLSRAIVYRSATLADGQRLRSHAKFVVIDHEVLLLTSANFSYSAENRNVEFGLLVRDSALAESVEATMTSKHGSLYELM
ncbi:MAG TPA: DISARM system phospholipase D-like protein DrmC [Solirubrobacter sp.]|nr:DISARM system phospholipase D-like protein DrmC [Solirubrobacter sp.]